MGKLFRLVPAPAPAPPMLPLGVLPALGWPILLQRTPEFKAVFARVRTGRAEMMGTRGQVVVLAAPDSGGREAAVVNLCSPGDEVLGVRRRELGEPGHALTVAVHLLTKEA